MMSTVRFTINSSKITDEEMVNVYNTAQYLKDNPNVNVVIKGYADKDTGTSQYNQALSERRAKAVYDVLTKPTASTQIVSASMQKAAPASPIRPTTGTAS